MSRRPSSTKVRRQCFEYWAVTVGLTRYLKCYICGREWKEGDWWQVEAEHEIARAIGLASMGPAVDLPPNVKPCCSGKCESLSREPSSPSTALPASLSTLGPKPIRGHRDKTKNDVGVLAKADRLLAKKSHFKRASRPMPGSKRSPYKRQYNRLTKRWETVRRDK